MTEPHRFEARLVWTGAAKGPTANPETFARDFRAEVGSRPPILGNAPPAFHGDGSGYNPEELLLIALSACHMLSYLFLCARGGIAVVDYRDEPHGLLGRRDGRTQVIEARLRPRVTIARGGDRAKAERLHAPAARGCFIANSVNFPVLHEAIAVETEA